MLCNTWSDQKKLKVHMAETWVELLYFMVNLRFFHINRNYNYGKAGEALKVDLLNHPEYIEDNATLAFQAAIWRWMTPVKKHQPSAHDVFVGKWKPTKNDTLAKRLPGFGTTINILYGNAACGQGEVDSMNNPISHYLHYLDLMGVGREEAGSHDVLTCAEQEPFESSSSWGSSLSPSTRSWEKILNNWIGN